MYKKALATSLIVLFSCASGVYLEATGYESFDSHNGQNIICDVDPSCRPLTTGEISAARDIFGDEINYDKIKIFNHFNYVSFLTTNILGITDFAAITPRGHIFFIKDSDYSDDFSKHPHKLPLFLHEMTHVWQDQTKKNLITQALKEYSNARFHYKELYNLDINTPKLFRNFGIEQQGKAIEEYQRMMNHYKAAPPIERSTYKHCEVIRRYEEKIGGELPLKPFMPCQDKTDITRSSPSHQTLSLS